MRLWVFNTDYSWYGVGEPYQGLLQMRFHTYKRISWSTKGDQKKQDQRRETGGCITFILGNSNLTFLQALKEEKQRLEEMYGWAILDGRKEKVGNFRIEPPGLFRGRGNHPKTGTLKVLLQLCFVRVTLMLTLL
jgi:DNA topoisomerase IB